MKKLSKNPVGISEIKSFLDQNSDFSFEMMVLQELRRIGFECQHSGTYVDPNTKKTRQFDVRASLTRNNWRFVLAVECKNLRESYPLLIHTTTRKSPECFHNVLMKEVVSDGRNSIPRSEMIVLRGGHTIYKSSQMVGRSTDQVGIDDQGRVKSNDSDVFDKMSQALNSLEDLIVGAYFSPANQMTPKGWAFLPVVVVPNDRLWEVQYDENGTRKGEPQQVEKCKFYIGKFCEAGNFTVSHLEFVTISGLKSWFADFAELDPDFGDRSWFFGPEISSD